MKIVRKLFLSFLGITMLCFGAPNFAQANYPSRPINIIIPFGPGGAVDIAARILAEYFQTKHKITLNVICNGTGAGAPAMLQVANSRPDGYTYGFPSLTTFSTTPQVRSTGYTLESYKGVVGIMDLWLSLSVRADSGIKNMTDFLERAKKEPGKINFATHSPLSTQRLLMGNILLQYPELNVPSVVFESGHAVSVQLLGGHVSSAFGVTTNQLPYVQSGEFTMIGVSSPERLPELADIPTFKEQLGHGDSFVIASPHGLVAPKGTPDAVIIKMASLMKEALEDPGVKEKFTAAGLPTDYKNTEDFQVYMQEIWAYIGKALDDLNLR